MSRRKITDIKNGIARPEAGTIYRAVFDISDTIYDAEPKYLRAEVLKECSKFGISVRSASVAHCLWRKYRGLTKRRLSHEIQV